MTSYWVAIGARSANKLSPPCLKGNALPILKTLPGFLELRLQVNDGKTTGTFAAVVSFFFPLGEKQNKKAAEVTSKIDWNYCVICARRSKRRSSQSSAHVDAPI